MCKGAIYLIGLELVPSGVEPGGAGAGPTSPVTPLTLAAEQVGARLASRTRKIEP